MSFEKILEYCENYKIKELGITESGTFNYKGKILKKGHIIPKKLESKNLIDKGFFRDESKIYEDLKNQKKLHRFFHHLNSSQAMAINFVVPLIQKDLLKSILSSDKSKVCENTFEYEMANEETFEKKPHTKTNFDFYIKTNSKQHFYEFKYSEESFGSAKNDEAHHNKFLKVYKPVLQEICKKIPEETIFLKEYQLWRLLCHLQYGEVYIVLSCMRKNLIEKIEEAKGYLNDDYKNSIHILKLEDLVNELKQSKDTVVSKHYLEFEKKYLKSFE